MLGGVVFALLAAHLAFAVGSEVTGHPLYFLPRLFNLGAEANIPTFASALLLLGASVLLSIAAMEARAKRTGHVAAWSGLGGGFMFMSVDEAAGIHDQVVARLLQRVDGGGGWIAARYWYLAYAPILLALAVVYVPFLWRLLKSDETVAILFSVAGGIYLCGAIGMEAVEHAVRAASGPRVAVLLTIACEEGMELAGVALFIYALLRYIGDHGYSFHFCVAPHGRRP